MVLFLVFRKQENSGRRKLRVRLGSLVHISMFEWELVLKDIWGTDPVGQIHRVFKSPPIKGKETGTSRGWFVLDIYHRMRRTSSCNFFVTQWFVQNAAENAVKERIYESFPPISHMNFRAHGFTTKKTQWIMPGDHRIPVKSHTENIKTIVHRAGWGRTDVDMINNV